MTDEERFSREGETFVPPPKDFDPLTADLRELVKYGLPQRPDPQSQPGLSVLWERRARQYRRFDHLQTDVRRILRRDSASAPEASRLQPLGTCGYSLDSTNDPFISLFVTWSVPNLLYTPSPRGINNFRIFVGLGSLDVHVEMTVDTTQNVSAAVSALSGNGYEETGLPVKPGDVVSAGICLGKNPPGRAAYVLANETTLQTVNFGFDSGLPGAFTINAGISRDMGGNPALNPLAHFGAVYFDEISAYTKAGRERSLTEGQAVTMVDADGTRLATPFRLNGSAFKIVASD